MFDLTRKYRIQSGEDIDYAKTLSDAKYIAGEWQLARERIVEIVRQHGRFKRWKATLEPSGDVRLDTLYSDGLPDLLDDYQARRAMALAKQIDKQERRRKRRLDTAARKREAEERAKSEKFGRGVKRAVVCLSTEPPRRFEQASDAARWLGVKHQSLFAALKPRKNGSRRKCCGMEFIYEDEMVGATAGAV
jgi:hypothetical protein